MTCRTFRERHLEYVDRVLAGPELAAMERHLSECSACARHDIAMRRGILVLRNLSPIELSPGFYNRLTDRLHQGDHAELRTAISRAPRLGSFVAAAASVAAVAALAASAHNWSSPRVTPVLAPVVATLPPAPPSPVVNSGFVASASAGVPVWPAAMMAEQEPARFASAELEFASWGGVNGGGGR